MYHGKNKTGGGGRKETITLERSVPLPVKFLSGQGEIYISSAAHDYVSTASVCRRQCCHAKFRTEFLHTTVQITSKKAKNLDQHRHQHEQQ